MNRVRELRMARGLSQEDIARLLGVATDSVGRWERGKAVPRKRMAVKLAKRLGVTVEGLGLDS